MVMDVAMTVGNAAICLGMSGCSAWCRYSQSHGRPWLAAHVTGGWWLDLFTLTFDSSPIKGEGDWWLCCHLCRLGPSHGFSVPFR